MVCATFSPVLTGTVLLSTTMRYSVDVSGNFTRDALDETKIDASVRLRRRGHGDEDDLGDLDGLADGGGETEAAGGDIAFDEFLEAGS